MTSLDLQGNTLGALPAGVFDPLTALTSLTLASNRLTTVPAGVLDRLTALTTLSLYRNGMTSLPAGVFDRLTALTSLDLGTNSLSSLPAGIFDSTAALVTLWLDANQLATLPPGVFDALTALKNLHTQGNPLTCLPFIPASVTGGKRHATNADSSFAACGAGVTPSKSGVSVGAGASESYTLVLAASPNRFANSGAVVVNLSSSDTAKATVSPSTLTFGTGNWSAPQTLTVTGVAAGSAVISHTAAGGGYGAATAPSVAAAVTTATLAAGAVTDTKATLTLTGHAGTWYLSPITSGGNPTCTEMSGITALSLSGLDPGTRYTFKAYSDATCTTEIAAESFDTLGLTADAATATGLKLTLANHTGSWYWKRTAPSAGQCAATAVSGPTTGVTGLTAGTSYTFEAYSDSACTTANKLATAAAHATLPPAPGKPTVSVAGQAIGAVQLGALLGGGAARVMRWEYAKQAGNGGYDATWTQIDNATAKLLLHTVTGLAPGTAYRFKVRAVNASGAGASAESDVVTPRGQALTASAVEAATATLTLSGHTGNWYHKRITPSGDDTCTQVTTPAASLSTLDTGTSYTFKAYSDSNCTAANELAAATFLTKPGQVTGVAATAGYASLNVGWTARTDAAAGYKVQWKSGAQGWSATREAAATTNATALTGLANAVTHTLRVAAVNATGAGAWSADATGTPSASAKTLTASAVQATTATLTIVNHSGDWYHKHTVPGGGQCSATAVSGTTASLGDLDTGTHYIWTAYSGANCTAGTELASVPFLTAPGQVTGVTAAARHESLAVGWTAASGAASYTVQWKSGAQDYESGGAREATVRGGATTTRTIPALTNGTAYTIRVRATNATGDGAWSADAAGTPGAALTASAVGTTTATLALAGHDGAWYYRHTVPAGDTSCTRAGGATASLDGLTAGTRYTFRAYRDAVCATEIASAAPFLTAPGRVTGVTATARHQSLVVGWTAVGGAASYTVQWRSGTQRYESGGAREATVGHGTTAYTIKSLTNDTVHTLRVRADNATGAGAWSADATGTPAAVTLTASAVEAATATLTLANHGGDWYWKYTVPSGDTSCTAAGSAATASPAGLDAGTSYTFKAYGDAACATELTSDATDAELLTKPARVTGVTAAPGNASLSVGWTASSDTVTGYKVQWKSGAESYNDGARQIAVTGLTTTAATVTGLTNGTASTVRVTAYNATGGGAPSAEASATPAATLTASAVRGRHRDPDHRPRRRLVLEAHRAGDAPGHLLHGGGRRDEDGEPGGARRRYELHLQGVRRCQLHRGDHQRRDRRGAPDQARPGDGGNRHPRRHLARGGLDGGKRHGDRLQGAVEVGRAGLRRHAAEHGHRRRHHQRQHHRPGSGRLHGAGRGVQRHRRRRRLGGGERRGGGADARAAHRPDREPGRHRRDRVVDGGQRRRRGRHPLGDPAQGGQRRVRRLEGRPRQRRRHPEAHRHEARQRRRLLVQGAGGEQRRRRCGLGGVRRRDAGAEPGLRPHRGGAGRHRGGGVGQDHLRRHHRDGPGGHHRRAGSDGQRHHQPEGRRLRGSERCDGARSHRQQPDRPAGRHLRPAHRPDGTGVLSQRSGHRAGGRLRPAHQPDPPLVLEERHPDERAERRLRSTDRADLPGSGRQPPVQPARRHLRSADRPPNALPLVQPVHHALAGPPRQPLEPEVPLHVQQPAADLPAVHSHLGDDRARGQ